MAYFQKTIVRYERDPRAAEDADFYEKWCCPCFLGTDDKGDTHWYGYTFDDLISAKKSMKSFFSILVIYRQKTADVIMKLLTVPKPQCFRLEKILL